jgi:hypothetical protein
MKCCPLCGAVAELIEFQAGFQVQCSDKCVTQVHHFKEAENAIRAWNHRPHVLSVLKPLLEEAKRTAFDEAMAAAL